MTHPRRVFLMTVAASSVALGFGVQAQTMLDEKTPQAMALGYVADTKMADKARFPKHEDSQKCANCSLFQGKPGDATGGCLLFPGKMVVAEGWCSAWVKKA